MSTAILKFQQPTLDSKAHGVEPTVLAAAIEASPNPVMIAENGKLIYSNPSFAQLPSEMIALAATAALNWRSTEFAAAGRTFSLTTRRQAQDLDSSDSQHLAIIGRLLPFRALR